MLYIRRYFTAHECECVCMCFCAKREETKKCWLKCKSIKTQSISWMKKQIKLIRSINRFHLILRINVYFIPFSNSEKPTPHPLLSLQSKIISDELINSLRNSFRINIWHKHQKRETYAIQINIVAAKKKIFNKLNISDEIAIDIFIHKY